MGNLEIGIQVSAGINNDRRSFDRHYGLLILERYIKRKGIIDENRKKVRVMKLQRLLQHVKETGDNESDAGDLRSKTLEGC